MTTREPSSGPRRGISGRLLLAGALVVGAALVAASGFLILQSDRSTDGVEAIYDGSELTLELGDGTSITIPAGAAQPGSRVRITPADPESLPPPPAYVREVLGAWDIDVEGGIVAPVTLRFPEPATDNMWLLLHYRDGEWHPNRFDLIGGQVVAVVDELSLRIIGDVWNAVTDLIPDEWREWISDRKDAFLNGIRGISGEPECLRPHPDISTDNSAGNTLVAGCADARQDAALTVKNRRRVFAEVYAPDNRATTNTIAWAPTFRDNAIVIPGESLSLWSSEFPGRPEVEIRGAQSIFSALATFGFAAIQLIPGIGELIDHDVVEFAVGVLMGIDAFADAINHFTKGMIIDGFESLIDAIDLQLLIEVIELLAKELVENPKIARIVANASAEIIAPAMKFLDVADVILIFVSGADAARLQHANGPGYIVFEERREVQDNSRPAQSRPTQESIGTGTTRPPSAVPTPPPTPTPTPTPPPTPTPSVSAGLDHTCAVDADGSVTCWGYDDEGQASPPGGEFLTVSAGEEHTCGILTDRSVVCWGRDHQGQSSAPSGGFVSVSAGWEDTCGVRTDGSLECWGRVTTFGLDDSPGALFRSVSVAQYHACGVMQDREVACWGYSHRTTSLPPGPFASVSAGEGLGCGLRTDGSVACWGSDDSEQVIAPSGTFVSISASTEGHRACGVRTDGSALCWGAGRLVPAGARNLVLPVSIQPDGRFSSISAGGGPCVRHQDRWGRGVLGGQ